MNNRIQSPNGLVDFYTIWSSKSDESIEFDVRSAERKADAIVRLLPQPLLNSLERLLDFGCGYGAVINRLKHLQKDRIRSAIGFDFSETAITVARKRCDYEVILYEKLPGLDVRANASFLRQHVKVEVDAILLIDLLEHVPDCFALIAELAPLTRMFLIKLPIESSVLDNYLFPKEYPGSLHSDGHLREFDVNNVHYFIRTLGLTPVFETIYLYDSKDSFPPLPKGTSLKGRVGRAIIRIVKTTLSRLLPAKISLRLVGGGGYICLASFSEQHTLKP